jgi:hypothetical protein
MKLIVGARHLDRVLEEAGDLLVSYRTDDGLRYLDYRPSTDPDRLMPEDLAVTILINSRVKAPAFKSAQDNGASLPLEKLPAAALEETTSEDRDQVADLIAEMVGWDGFAASVATKILHPESFVTLSNTVQSRRHRPGHVGLFWSQDFRLSFLPRLT